MTGYYYIEYLNKDKGFKQDRKSFLEEWCAVDWGKTNLDNFHPDMVKFQPITPHSKIMAEMLGDSENNL